MTFLERLQQNNIYLVRRIEIASAYSPLVDEGSEKVKQISRAAAKAKVWEDVPDEYRRLVEDSEVNRDKELRDPLPFTGKL